MNKITLIILLLIVTTFLNAQGNYKDFEKSTILSTNNLLVSVGNTGFILDWGNQIYPLSLKGQTDSRRYLNFMEKLTWGGKVDGEIFYDGKSGTVNLYPGYISQSGEKVSPYSREAGLFRLAKNISEMYSEDEYVELMKNYPVDAGAPWKDIDGDGFFNPEIDAPLLTGDEMIWFVGNDFDNLQEKWTRGIEIRSKIYAFNNNDIMDNVVFKEFTFVNKSDKTIEDFYIGYQCDTDIGDSKDDAMGCAPDLNLGFVYNYFQEDEIYGNITPVMGIQAVNVSKNKYGEINKISSFVNPEPYIDPHIDLDYNYEYLWTYNTLSGLSKYTGESFTNNEGVATKYLFAGNPYHNTGWNYNPEDEVLAGDVKLQLNAGPFDIKPGEEVSVTYAFMGIVEKEHKKGIQIAMNLADVLLKNYTKYSTPREILHKIAEDDPGDYSIAQNYPNPFNPSTTIKYSVPVETKVTAEVFNILGKKVAVLVNERKDPGNYAVLFDGANLSAGIYFLKIEMANITKTIKMTLLK